MTPPWTLVTGGAKRLGATICRMLASEGLPVVVHYNQSGKKANAVVEECRGLGVKAEAVHGDFSSREGTETFIDDYLSRFSQTAHLVNNVGNYLVSSVMETEPDVWYSLFQTNLHAPFLLTRALVPSVQRHRGSILNIGVAGLQGSSGDAYCPTYTLTKSSLWMFTRSLAKELASSQVRVNMVSPGYIDNSVDLPKDHDKLPMGRAATCEEVARVVAFLIEEQNRYITGQNIEVAGGVRL